MASTPATERFPSSATAKVNIHSPKITLSEITLPNNIVDIPSSPPVIEFSTPRANAAINTAKDASEMDDPEPLRLSGSDNEGDGILEDGYIIEDNEGDMVERTETTSSNKHTIEQRDDSITIDTSHHCSMTTKNSSKDGSPADLIKADETGAAEAADTCQSKTEQCTHAEEAPADSKVEANDEESGHKNEHNLGDGSMRKREEDDEMSEDDVFGDDEHTAVEMQRDANAASAQPRSVRLHLRPTFKAPNAHHLNSQDAKVSCDVTHRRIILIARSVTGLLLYLARLVLTIHQLGTRPLDLHWITMSYSVRGRSS